MHRTIVEHINQDASYNRGYQAGLKRAWDLIGEAAEWEKEQAHHTEIGNDKNNQAYHQARKMSLLHAQMILTKEANTARHGNV